MKTYRINEIFRSLQGEGFHTGTPAVFVRFSGCNLRCAFCDTQHESFELMTAAEIASAVKDAGEAPLIVLTGGEPALQVDDELVAVLRQLGATITIETNGTLPLPQGIDWVTLSPKTALIGGEAMPCVIKECDELKVVYCHQDLDLYHDIKTNWRFLQPCYDPDPDKNRRHLDDCVKAVMSHPKWRLSMQIHRILGIK